MNDVARLRAARALARGETKAAAAREAGVDRATIGRWVKDPAFNDMVLQAVVPDEADTPADTAIKGLADLVPMALKVLERAMVEGDVSPQAATVALNIVKAARTLEPPSEEDGPSSLTTLIARLDGQD